MFCPLCKLEIFDPARSESVGYFEYNTYIIYNTTVDCITLDDIHIYIMYIMYTVYHHIISYSAWPYMDPNGHTQVLNGRIWIWKGHLLQLQLSEAKDLKASHL